MTILGAGLGTPLVGVLSDHLAGLGLSRGESLRWALIDAQVAIAPAAVLFWWVRRRISKEIVS